MFKKHIKDFNESIIAALDSRQLNIQRLKEFLIFKVIRETDEYLEFKKQSKYFKEPNKDIIN